MGNSEGYKGIIECLKVKDDREMIKDESRKDKWVIVKDLRELLRR